MSRNIDEPTAAVKKTRQTFQKRRTPLPWSTNESDDHAAWQAAERERLLMIAYPFPVLDGEGIALLRLPKHLTRHDAERIKQALDALVTT